MKDQKTLLLVEDDAIIAMHEQSLLEAYGYAVIAVNSGERAVECFGGPNSIDLVLMDIDLGGGIDGTEAAVRILEGSEVPIVFLSSHLEPEIVTKTEGISSYGYVVKNSGITVLDASIKMAFKLHEVDSALRASEQKYRNLFDNALVGMFRTRLDGGEVLEFNKRYLSMLGMAREECVGKPSSIHWFDPSEREAMVERLTRDGALKDYPCRIRRANGEVMDCLTSLRLYRGTGILEGSIMDITELRRAQESLLEGEELYRNSYECAGIGISYYGVDGRVLSYNRLAAQNMGGRSEDFRDKSIYELFPQAEAAFYHDRIRKAAVSEEALVFEDLIHLPSMDACFISTFTRIMDSAGRLLGVQIISQDITERKRLEQKILSDRLEFEEAQKIARVGSWTYDAMTEQHEWSHEMYQIWGSDPALGPSSFAGRRKRIHPDDLPAHDEATRRALEHGLSYNLDLRLLSHDGCVRTVTAICEAVIDRDGEVLVLRGTVQDITERVASDSARRRLDERALKESEERLHLVLEASELGYWDCDLRADRVIRNERWAEMLGYTLGELEPTREQMAELLEPEDAGNIWQISTDHPAGASDYYKVKHKMRTKDGGYRWILDCGKVVKRDCAGRPLRACGTHRDITEEVENEERIRSILHEKELFLREVHHRIKNTLGTMKSLVFLQSHEVKDPRAVSAFENTERRIDAMILLYEWLYDLSSSFSNLPLKDYLCALIDQIAATFQRSESIRIEKAFEPFELDVKRIQPLGIIINEIITNMMKHAFTGRAEGKIVATGRLHDSRIRISIQDDGVGMPESVDFERSTGFGLTLVKGLARQLDGTVNIERGNGTKFTLEFER